MAGPHDVEFRVLGPLHVVAGTTVDLSGVKQRALLATLLAHRDHVVPTRHLVEQLWPDEEPASGHKAVQVHVSRLRRALSGASRGGAGVAAALETRPTGYQLTVAAGALDLDRFRSLAAEGRAAAAQGEHDRAAATLRTALAEWRGPAYADCRTAELDVHAVRLDDERQQALAARIEADMGAGRYAEVIPELEQLAAADPLREGTQAQLMRALYATGRQADALDRYRTARRAMATELGLEPGPELRGLEQAVLRHDPALRTQQPGPRDQADPEPPDGPRGRRTRRLARPAVGLLAAALLAVVALSTGVVRGDDNGSTDRTTAREVVDTGPDHLVEIDPATDRAISSVAVGSEPGPLAATPGAIWVANFGDRTVSRLELRSRQVRVVGGAPVALQVVSTLDGDVWLSSFTEPVVTLLAEDGMVSTSVPDAAPARVRLPSATEALAVGGGYLWVTSPADTGGKDQVFQVDLRTREVVRSIPVGHLPLFACVGYGAAWVSNYRGASVSVIRPGQPEPDTVTVPDGPLGIAAGEGAVWVASYWTHELSRLDPDTLRVVDSIDVGAEPLGVAVGAGSVWVASRGDHVVERIDPGSGSITARIRLHSAPQHLTSRKVGSGSRRARSSASPAVCRSSTPARAEPDPDRVRVLLRVRGGGAR